MANLELRRGNPKAALPYLAEGRSIVARDTPTAVLASAYEYKLGCVDFELGSLDTAL